MKYICYCQLQTFNWPKKLCFFFFLMFISLFILRESTQLGEGDRERERRERIPSRLRAVNADPNVGLHLINREIMT